MIITRVSFDRTDHSVQMSLLNKKLISQTEYDQLDQLIELIIPDCCFSNWPIDHHIRISAMLLIQRVVFLTPNL